MDRVFIIAEAGVNHNGSLEKAVKLVDVAKAAGADCVKFQTFKAEQVVSKYAEKAEYQRKQTGHRESQLEMIKKLELSYNDFLYLKAYCDKIGIEFLSTPFDLESIDFLEQLGLKRWKIPSGEITNLPYLIRIAEIKRPVILSTGMATLEEIKATVKVLIEYGANEITLLHCTTEYPAPFEEVNLNVLKTFQKEFNCAIGYSDHTQGIEIPIAAVAMGATTIEKHFTLDKNLEGPDHQSSLEPDELSAMVSAIRHVQVALGSFEKKPTPAEKKNIFIARKSIVAKRNINKGEFFNESNLAVKRPGNGISPMLWFDVMGKAAKRDFAEDELIEL